MNIEKVLLFIIGVTVGIVVQAQIPTNTEQQIENLADLLETELEDDQLLQQLDFWQRNPVNLNMATADELAQLKIITDLQIQNLLQYRKLFGNLLSIYELQAVPTWNITTIRKLLPFITVADPASLVKGLEERISGGEHTFLLRNSIIPEKQKGYNKSLPTYYAGSPHHLFFRYRYQYKNLLQWGITADKDAGEVFWGKGHKGFDFYSAHLFIRKLGIIKAMALGDYSVNMGQGLIQWQSLAFKKGADALAIKRQSAVLQPYSSAGEYNYHRGAGITLGKGAWEATVFASHTPISANKVIDTLTNDEAFSSFLNSGLHRTVSERADRNSITQSGMGSVIKYAQPLFSICFNSVFYHFSHPLNKRNEPYNRFAPYGEKWANYSIDYSITHRNVHFFGEGALDWNGGKAFIAGAQLAVDPKVDFSLLYRHIGKNYAAIYGNAFTESVVPANEKGFYTGLAIRPVPGWRIDGYADIYSFPFLRFRTDAPAGGKDFLVQLSHQPNKRFETYIRYRAEAKQRNETGTDSVFHYIINKPRQNLRLHAQYRFSPAFAARWRAETVLFDKDGKESESGFLSYIEGVYKGGFTWGGALRLQYFNTDGYNSRLYAFESDVLYSYTIPPFFDKGWRYYFNLHYDIGKKCTVWGRWAQSLYTNKKTIGSGLDEIKGNTKSEVKVQVRFIL